MFSFWSWVCLCSISCLIFHFCKYSSMFSVLKSIFTKKKELSNCKKVEWATETFCWVPVVVPAWVYLGHAVYPIWVLGHGAASVSEGAAPTGADADEGDEHDDVEDGDLVPVLADLLHYASLARVALVAEDVRGIVPPIAVLVLRSDGHASTVLARCWWFAATGLQDSSWLQWVEEGSSRENFETSSPR